jgi:RNA polymerase subunit RPABC4/transcription elongation factor Spt4
MAQIVALTPGQRTQLKVLVQAFDDAQRMRTSTQIRISHLQNNRRCLNCETDFMPKRFETCPECHSEESMLKKSGKRVCKSCDHEWTPAGDVCPKCHGEGHVPAPVEFGFLEEVLVELERPENLLRREIGRIVRVHPVWTEWAVGIKGAGEHTIGLILGLTDFSRLENVSKFWARAGWGNKGGQTQRKRAGEKIDYDPKLRKATWQLGKSLMMAKGSYYRYYKREYERQLAQGLTNSHANNRAFRHMLKLALSHIWEVARQSEGLSVPEAYAFSILGHDTGSKVAPAQMLDKPEAVCSA